MRQEFASVYNPPARLFHWATALLLLVQYVLAWAMPDVHRDTKPVGLIAWHLGVGVVIVLLVLVRLLWRSVHPAPPEAGNLPAPLRALARYTHWLLYLLLIAVPLMGWANASSRDWPVTLLASIPMPPLSPAGSPVGHALGDWHRVLSGTRSVTGIASSHGCCLRSQACMSARHCFINSCCTMKR